MAQEVAKEDDNDDDHELMIMPQQSYSVMQVNKHLIVLRVSKPVLVI